MVAYYYSDFNYGYDVSHPIALYTDMADINLIWHGRGVIGSVCLARGHAAAGL